MPVPRSLACVRLVVLPLALLPSACSISNADGDCNTENNCNYVVSSSAPSSTTPTDPTTTTTTTTMGGTMSGSESEGTTEGTTASTMTGGLTCGNKMVEDGEECDDGNNTPGDGCENDCSLTPSCGDGKVDSGEECDDGNTENTDACVACKMATCGDGFVWDSQEQCDAGAENGMYNSPCAADCQGPGPFCGDQKINGSEQCDDGPVDPMQDGMDDCSNDCRASRYVFVTDAFTKGKLVGGIEAVDMTCAALGNKVKPGTNWKVWLSDDKTWPAMRMDTAFEGYYRRPDGMPVAKGWADLINDTNLLNPINITADNKPAIDNLLAWTGTNAAGMTLAPHCNNWTASVSEVKGRVGAVGAITSQWTDQEFKDCNASFRLYCFED